MKPKQQHTFHIPVMGLAFTIDSPVKVARFGISSVISIIEDHLIEQMREFYCRKMKEEYIPIELHDEDHRARRITAYLDLINRLVKKQTDDLRKEAFINGNEIIKYFELLPSSSPVRILYDRMKEEKDNGTRMTLQNELRKMILAGSIDTNIMTKCDRTNFSADGNPLPPEYSDAMSALRGFARSGLSSSVVFSAGLNPRLYSYCESFKDFFPDAAGNLKKKIVLKVSDYRSALVQGKFFAKKGLWVSEFRIESGLNCGGHAFATDGLLLGPILEEFKNKRAELTHELYEMCNTALLAKGYPDRILSPAVRITVQGGIGTAAEHDFLLQYYELDSTGWGSPFLLVPEVTNVDDETLHELATAKQDDYYLSHASPLGVPIHNFRKSSSEALLKKRIEQGRPGSPCYKKFLAFNTEFTKEPICASSRQYQHLKIEELKKESPSLPVFNAEFERITEKECLCEGLGTAALLKNKIEHPKKLKAVAICPGPNLAWFSGVFSLKEMVDHIYGRINILNSNDRPNMFINELKLYVDHLKNELEKNISAITTQKMNSLNTFKANLLKGIEYYKELIPKMKNETRLSAERMTEALEALEAHIHHLRLVTA